MSLHAGQIGWYIRLLGLFSVYLWASWFDRGVALRGFLPLTSKSLILPPDIDTLDLVERGLWCAESSSALLHRTLQRSRNS
ncbi:uncharacterized protein LOC142631242 isoform X4 [Castanea sativa]|uniref:uncharacterized protein LOC142631242 isoform X4 n=1 Tax=Castanea sativa TaxID=21020 RepID=UPI003F6531C2